MGIDLFGSFLEINIDGEGLEKISKSGSNFVESVTVKIGLLHMFEVQVVLNPTIQEAIHLLNSGKMGLGMNVQEDTGSSSFQGLAMNALGLASTSESKFNLRTMNIRMHYGGRSSKWYSAIVLAPHIKVGADGIQITLNGIGHFFKSNKIENAGERKGVLKNIIVDLMTENNENTFVTFEASAEKVLNQKAAFTQYKNNMETVREILHKNGCQLVLVGSNDPDRADYVIQTIEASRRKSEVVLVAYGQIDPTRNIFPVLDMECPTTNLTLPNGPWANFINNNDSVKKKVIEKINPFDEVNKAASAISATSPDGSMGGGSISTSYKGTQVNTDIRQVENIKRLYQSYVSRVFEYNVTTVGIVDLIPGRLISVHVGEGSNLVKALSGEYDISEVTHTFSSTNGVETSLNLLRTGGVLSKASNQGANLISSLLNGNFNIQLPEDLEDIFGGLF